MDASSRRVAGKPNYAAKGAEVIVSGRDVQARVVTLAPEQTIPLHYHARSRITISY